MYHSAAVSVFEGSASLGHVSDLYSEGQWRLAGDYFLQAFAFQILHGDKRGAAGLTHFVNGDDIGVL